MVCAKCGTDNREGRRFCAECGAPFAAKCARCGVSNEPNEKFCGSCGAQLASQSATSSVLATQTSSLRIATEQPEAVAGDGERKTVTALFADIKGSTELMRELDPEEARAIVDPVLQLMMAAVHRYGGYVAQSTGDGIFALFGAPNDGKIPVEARVGVNTGEVVVRTIETGGHTEYTPVGHVTNLAARMQTAAPPGSIAASEATQRLCEGYFEFRALGPTVVKGLNAPVEVYEVMRAGPLRTHFQLAARRGLTRFVGRERELQQMKRALEMTRSGHGQLIAVVAEAGIGKSRLVYEFRATLPGECRVLEAYSVSHGKVAAWLPVLELLHIYFGIEGVDDPRTRREKVSAKLAALDSALSDRLPYLFGLLGIQESPDPLVQMDPQIRRQRTLETIKRVILRESLKRPLVVIFEDLHWIDGETQALVNLLADAASARVLLLVTYRPEYRHEWSGRGHYLQLRLDALGDENAAAMLAALLGEGAELGSLKRLIAERTGGNPFFIEEMVQALFDEGALVRNGVTKVTRPLSQLRLPPTVQGVLASRIDRLPAAHKDLLQTLAVMGRESPFALIKNVTSLAEGEAERMLLGLQAAEFIYEQPALTEVEYVFKHTLTQEVAYNSLLVERRRLLHGRTGAAMEALYAGRLDDHLSELARHYQCSGNTGKALEYLQRAGGQAIARSSHVEAIGLFTSALELLKTLPETLERAQQELTLQLGLGSTLMALKGYTVPEVGPALGRASELCRQIGFTPHLFSVLGALAGVHLVRAELRRSHELAEEALAIAEGECDTSRLLSAHFGLGIVLFLMGELTSARSHLERAISLYNRARSESSRAYIIDPGVGSQCWAAITLCCLGFSDQALERNRQSVVLARELSHPFSLALALALSAYFHKLRKDGNASLGFANECLQLATEHGFEQMSSYGLVHRGGALIELNRAEEGIVQLEDGIAALRATGSEYVLPSFLAALAGGYGSAGRAAKGLAAAAEGLAVSKRTGERWFDAELYRLRGELLLKCEAQAASKVEDEADACFRQALEIARRQQAKWWELRATTSLARLLAKQGHREEARTMLAEIYSWFTEGFDTADLKEAKALLDELAE
jgi:class 3 adenylate cyclase/tetratricopeptide (TPR) repeat protein